MILFWYTINDYNFYTAEDIKPSKYSPHSDV